MSEHGEKFIDICALNKLVIGGSIFPHKEIHKATWVSPDHITENQIDHICISKKFRRSLQDVRAKRGADEASDHHLLTARLKLKLKKNRTEATGNRQKYKIKVRKGKKAAVANSHTRAKAQEEYTDAKGVVRKSIKAEKLKYISSLAEEAEEAAGNGNMMQLYDTTRKMSGKYSKPPRPLKDKEGNTIVTKEGQLNRWAEHFEELLNRFPPPNPPDIRPEETDLPISCDIPSREIRKVVQKQKSEAEEWEGLSPADDEAVHLEDQEQTGGHSPMSVTPSHLPPLAGSSSVSCRGSVMVC
ncbi:hypothetical protein SKAU_G00382430 [Synaphobranchus kaupii]|uniref:Uncharacterized protein n=1 Tax=Synaphobranchus kaupii TaxID=118154 RepID=A0A9Q1EDY2_SYNKA|nr:hypothetical protein SKAU_G00382430 [Synaphobranchus kaupii]